MTVMLRVAVPDDAPDIAVIYAHHVLHGTASYETVPPTPDAMREKINVIAARGWPFLVACDSERLVGYAYATQFRDRPAYAYACEDSIYIAADRTGQGIGRILLSGLMASGTQCGFRQMVAVIGGAEPASVALHAASGFRHAGRLSAMGWKAGRWLDTVYMQIALGAGATTRPDEAR
jgi:phosphinothricin acetyltransferase